MIPRAYIDEWRQNSPWSQDAWVEQDLVVSRAIVEIFRGDGIAESLAFRGGTALYKLHLEPARYSEDIDLVQIRPEPIGSTFDEVRRVLDPWLGEPRRQLKEGSANLVYRFESEDSPPVGLRLKIEINSRAHFAELGHLQLPFRVSSRWFSGEAKVTTFDVNELLATKLRALYQRKKGRDLFDLWNVLEQGTGEPRAILQCFARYMAESGQTVSRAQFEANLAGKAADRQFRGDITPLVRPDIPWDFETGLSLVREQLIEQLPGDPWKGDGGSTA